MSTLFPAPSQSALNLEGWKPPKPPRQPCWECGGRVTATAEAASWSRWSAVGSGALGTTESRRGRRRQPGRVPRPRAHLGSRGPVRL